MPKHGAQLGLSLLELLVAMAISSFLILGITQVYLDNRRGYVFQQNLSENQENSRYALLILHQQLTKAGYRREPYLEPETSFPAVSSLISCPAFKAGQSVAWNGETESLCIRYHPYDDKDRDCIGNLARNNGSLTKPYSASNAEIIIERYSVDTSTQTLRCQTIHTDGAGNTLNNSAGSGEIITGIVRMQFQFGVGTNTDTQNLSQYTTADTTNQILSIRYSALLRSSNSQLRDAVSVGDALTQWQSLTNSSESELSVLKSADSGQLYQVLQNTVTLRNILP